MMAQEAWRIILNSVKNKHVDICLKNKIDIIPAWFEVSGNDFCLSISSSKTKKPSANIEKPFVLNYNEFQMIFAAFFKKGRSKNISKEDYVFATIEHFCMKVNDDYTGV